MSLSCSHLCPDAANQSLAFLLSPGWLLSQSDNPMALRGGSVTQPQRGETARCGVTVQQSQQQSFCSRTTGRQGGDTKPHPVQPRESGHVSTKKLNISKFFVLAGFGLGWMVPASAWDTSVTCCPLPAGTGISDFDHDTNGQHTPHPQPDDSQRQCQGSLLSSCHPRQPALRLLRRENSFLHRSEPS